MSVIPAAFLQTRPEDVERLGGNVTALAAASLLALVRWATQRDDVHDRVTVGGHIWWRASYADVGESLGVTKSVVGRLVRNLVEADELLTSNHFAGVGDQTLLYRLPNDQPEYSSVPVVSSQNTDSHRSEAGTGTNSYGTETNPHLTDTEVHRDRYESALSSLYRDNRETRENGDAARARAQHKSGSDFDIDSLFARNPSAIDDLSKAVSRPEPKRVPSQRLDVEEAKPYGGCGVCSTRLNEDGGCPRCLLRSGGWRRRGTTGDIA